MPHLVGRARALEISLACEDFSAELAQAYGLINRALPNDELDDFVARIASRIALFPRSAIKSTKLAMEAALVDPHDALLEESHQFNLLRGTPEAQQRMASFMSKGAQTREVELNLDHLIQNL